jgi:hypothetical protein
MAKKDVVKKGTFKTKKQAIVNIHDDKLKKKLTCFKCGREIVPGEKFVFVGTYELQGISFSAKTFKSYSCGMSEEIAFHCPCWKEHLVDMIKGAIENQTNALVNSPQIKSLFGMAQQLIPVRA